MGTRPTRSNALLAFFRQYRRWVVAFFLSVIFFEAVISYTNYNQQQNVWKSISTLLRNEVNSANSYQISRALSDMEKEGWIKCVQLVETSNEIRIFYDTTTQSNCGYFSNKTDGSLTAINGSTWELSFATPENIWLFIVRFTIPFLIGFGLLYSYQFLSKQKKQQEAARLKMLLEKDFLLDITKQTRHDIASPIGALKLVVQKIDAPPEYLELLQGISDRIEGIFSHLKNIEHDSVITSPNMPLQLVSIDQLVSKIILEKEFEKNLPQSTIKSTILPTSVIANEIELGRILSNILNNAVESAKPDETLKIEIDSTRSDKYYTIRIKDNGKGMSPEVLAKAGTKGFSFGKPQSNSGIGLFHAKNTVQAFGGDLEVESKLCIGTTIQLRLRIEDTGTP